VIYFYVKKLKIDLWQIYYINYLRGFFSLYIIEEYFIDNIDFTRLLLLKFRFWKIFEIWEKESFSWFLNSGHFTKLFVCSFLCMYATCNHWRLWSYTEFAFFATNKSSYLSFTYFINAQLTLCYLSFIVFIRT
jgi:hypothetical protein